MKGIIFSIFGEMIEETFGLAMWDKLIQETKPISKGVYTAGQTYNESELFSYVGLLSKITNKTVQDLVRGFGRFMATKLPKIYPEFYTKKSFKEFLQSIDGVIHVEVKKLYPGASLPSFTYEDPAPNKLVMIYKSPRKLCHLAEGLIQGSAEHFKVSYLMKQTQCLHKEASCCRFEIDFL